MLTARAAGVLRTTGSPRGPAHLLHARCKTSTGIVGLPVQPEAKAILEGLYTKTLSALEVRALPRFQDTSPRPRLSSRHARDPTPAPTAHAPPRRLTPLPTRSARAATHTCARSPQRAGTQRTSVMRPARVPLEAFPASAEYAKVVGGIAKERLAVVKSAASLPEIEAKIGAGQVEQLIEQAHTAAVRPTAAPPPLHHLRSHPRHRHPHCRLPQALVRHRVLAVASGRGVARAAWPLAFPTSCVWRSVPYP